MKAYSITLLAVSTICFLVLVLFLINIDYLLEILGVHGANARMMEVLRGFLLMGLLFVSLLGYAMSKLLISGNKFFIISHSVKKSDVVNAFKNLRLYWMITGIALIILIIVLFFMSFKILPVLL
jgi:hypothetical protein